MLEVVFNWSQIVPYQCLYIQYQSLEDWSLNQDILRCNPSFHSRPRNDCAIVNLNPGDLNFVRIYGLYQCQFSSGRSTDIAFCRLFKESTWRPKAKWDGCRVFEEANENTAQFVSIEYVVRGAHMIPVFSGVRHSRKQYFNDVIDGDMLLRAGNWIYAIYYEFWLIYSSSILAQRGFARAGDQVKSGPVRTYHSRCAQWSGMIRLSGSLSPDQVFRTFPT